MSAKIFGPSGISWAMAAETGIIAQSYGRSVTGGEVLIKNHEGETAAASYYDAQAEHTVSGYITGNDGIAAAAYGVVVVIANAISGAGVAAGNIICTGVTDTLAMEDFQQIEITAKQFPLITQTVQAPPA